MTATSSVGNSTGVDTTALYAQLSTKTTGASGTSSASNAASDRFLKLLVTQMQNQDPLNPMDNAQVTSQMAQINTVTGLDKVNTSLQTLSTQFMQMQALQGAALVGHQVVVPGSTVSTTAGQPAGEFELAGPADAVKVEVLSGAGHVVDTLDLGAESSGRHSFDWSPPAGLTDTTGLKFRVTATSGAASVGATALMRDTVNAVGTGSDGLRLDLKGGSSVPWSDVRSLGN